MNKVLLIEDDPHIGELVSIHLKDLNCEVEVSTDGGTTFDQLPESTYAGTGWYREEGLYNSPEGPCFDEDSYPAWGTGYQTPDSSWWRKEYFNLTDQQAENILFSKPINKGSERVRKKKDKPLIGDTEII